MVKFRDSGGANELSWPVVFVMQEELELLYIKRSQLRWFRLVVGMPQKKNTFVVTYPPSRSSPATESDRIQPNQYSESMGENISSNLSSLCFHHDVIPKKKKKTQLF